MNNKPGKEFDPNSNTLLPEPNSQICENVRLALLDKGGYVDESFELIENENPLIAEGVANFAKDNADDELTEEKIKMAAVMVYQPLRDQVSAPLPEVDKEVYNHASYSVFSDKDFVINNLNRMNAEGENEELAESLGKFIGELSHGETEQATDLATVAILVYSSLRSQAEVNQMNEQFAHS